MALGGNDNDPNNNNKNELTRRLAMEADGVDMSDSPEYQMRKNVSAVLDYYSDSDNQNFHREFLLYMQDKKDISNLSAMEGQRAFVEAQENLQEIQLEVQERLGGPEKLQQFLNNLSRGLRDSKDSDEFFELLKKSTESRKDENKITEEERKIINEKIMKAQLKYVKMAQLVTYHDWKYESIMN